MSFLGGITVVVDDYDAAISYFTNSLGFDLIEDTDMGNGKRWVVIAPDRERGAHILLAHAVNGEQEASIGNQTGGRVSFFLYTDDFDRDYSRMLSAEVNFIEFPRDEEYGKVIVFKDLYGNKWDFIERKVK